MTSYSGYVEHSDFCIDPQSYYDTFNFLSYLAIESGEDAFYIGKVKGDASNFELYDVTRFKWNWYKGAWEHDR